jgi:hypothetical protein
MKRNTTLFALVLLIAGCSTAAFGWGNATHTYIAKQITLNGSTFDFRVAYAANLPDMCNLVLTEKGQTLSYMMHNFSPETNLDLLGANARATLYGIVLHGEILGADRTAHVYADPPTNNERGYFVVKGEFLADHGLKDLVAGILASAKPPVPEAIRDQVAYDIAKELGHDLAETAVDLLLKGAEDKEVGMEMIAAAELRSEDVPRLLASTFDQKLGFIIQNEKPYRQQMKDYGGVMTLDNNEAIPLLAAQQAPVAEKYIEAGLAEQGLKTRVSVSPELVVAGIEMALDVVGDYVGELQNTIDWINGNYIPISLLNTMQTTRELAAPIPMNVPAKEFALEGNYPNPFNPTTTIRYSLPAATRVSLKVYNAIGQEVAELVNGDLEAGVHSVQFNASGLASGIYFCRLQAGTIADTKKLVLSK